MVTNISCAIRKITDVLHLVHVHKLVITTIDQAIAQKRVVWVIYPWPSGWHEPNIVNSWNLLSWLSYCLVRHCASRVDKKPCNTCTPLCWIIKEQI